MYDLSVAVSVVGMWPITTLAARSRTDMAATASSAAFSAAEASVVGCGVPFAVTDGVCEDDGVGSAGEAGVHDTHATAEAATTAAKRPLRRAAVTQQA